MKANIIFCSIVVMLLTRHLALPIYAQQQQADDIKAELVLDFQTKKIQGMEKVEKLKPGDLFQVKVKNINLNLYKVTVNREDSITAKSDFKADLFTNFNIESLATLAGSFSPVGSVAGVVPFIMPQFPELFAEVIEEEKSLFKNFGVASPESMPDPNSKKIFEKDMNIEIATKIMNEAQNAFKILLNDLSRLKQEYHALDVKYTEPLTRFSVSLDNEMIDVDLKNLPDYSRMISEYNALYDKRIELMEKNTNIFINYSSGISEYLALLDDKNYKNLKETHEKLLKYHEEYTKKLAEIEGKFSSTSYNLILNEWITNTNNASNEFTSLPFQYTDQINKLDINVLPRNEDSGLQIYNNIYSFPSKERKDFWGVSSGFYVSGLRDEGYSSQASVIVADTVFNIVREDPGAVELGVSAMIRYGRHFNGTENFGWQLGFGPALSLTNKLRPRLQIGGGLYAGKSQKVLLDAGLVVGSVDRLSKVFTTEDSYAERPTDMMVSKTTTGLYFSVSYLFGL